MALRQHRATSDASAAAFLARPSAGTAVIAHHGMRERSRRRRRLAGGQMELNLVPMIDVVFLLLMYFLLTTNFTIGEEVFHMDAPNAAGVEREPDPFDLADQPLLVSVSTTGPGPADYALEIDLQVSPPATFEALFRFLDDNQVRPANPGGLFMPDTAVLIQPSRQTRWEHAVSALNAAVRARYANVQFIEPDE